MERPFDPYGNSGSIISGSERLHGPAEDFSDELQKQFAITRALHNGSLSVPLVLVVQLIRHD